MPSPVVFYLVLSFLGVPWLLVRRSRRRAPGFRQPSWISLEGSAAVRQRPIMTANELEFFERLRAACPECHVLAQVAHGVLMEPSGLPDGSQAWWRARSRFDRRLADYVVLRTDGTVVCVVELDDRTHDPVRDAARDALLASAGIFTVRYRSDSKPSVASIRKDVARVGSRPMDVGLGTPGRLRRVPTAAVAP